MNNQPAVNWEEDESESYSSNTSYNPRQYVERSNAPNSGWSGHVQGQQSPDHSGNMFFNAQQSVESLNVAIPGWSGNLQGQESLNPFFNTLQSVEIPNVANSGWLGNLQGQESLDPSGNMFFNTQRSDEIPNVANPGWLGNLQGQESLGPSGNMFFNTQRSDEIPNVANPGWLSNLQGQESLDPSGNQFFNTQQSVEIPNEANSGWSGNLQGQESLNPSGQKPRHGIVERVRGNQKVIELALRSLQRQKMPMQEQEQMKQQQMLQMQQNFPLSPPTKIDYKFGMGGERLMQYMNAQRDRPQDNDIEFWRNFVAEFFAPKAKKKWCVSIYGNKNHLTARVPQQNALEWQCKICNRQPGKGIEATAENLPRLFQTKYKSGILEERLHIQDPQEYITPAGLIIINYAKATQTSVLNQLHIVREGHLQVIFSPELKIGLLNFCVRSHDEFIPRSSLGPKVSQRRDAAEKYQACAQDQNRSSDPELQNLCDGVVASANQLEKSLDSISECGYPTAYLRFLKTADTVNVMKDLIDYSIATGSGAIESLANFPKRERTMVELGQQSQQDQMQQQSAVQNSPSNSSQQAQTRRY